MYTLHQVYRPLYGYGYGQERVSGEPTGAMEGKRIGPAMTEMRLGVEYYTYGQYSTIEDAQKNLDMGIQAAKERGWSVYDQGISELPDGSFQPWLKLVPPEAAAVNEALASQTGLVDLRGEAEEEKKGFPWGWVAVGVGGVLVVGIIAAVVLSKKGKKGK